MSETNLGVSIEVERLEHSYGDYRALREVSLSVQPAEFMTLLGASGSGKSTLLHAIAGLIEPSAGQVVVAGRNVTADPPERRDMGFVFQNYALFPHLTVGGNVAFPLQMRRLARRAIRTQVAEALELVGLDGYADRLPAELSGGQQQRVALARAIAFRPRVLLLDEPLGALDRQLRQQLGLDLRRVQRETGITTIYVTHDQEEAFVLSNRIAVMREGQIVQLDTPEGIYRKPHDLFVATFLGDLNALSGQVVDQSADRVEAQVGGQRITGTSQSNFSSGSRVTIGFRPEHLQVRARQEQSAAGFTARIAAMIFGGSWVRYELVLPDQQRATAIDLSCHTALPEGTDVWVAHEPTSPMFFFDDDASAPTATPLSTASQVAS